MVADILSRWASGAYQANADLSIHGTPEDSEAVIYDEDETTQWANMARSLRGGDPFLCTSTDTPTPRIRKLESKPYDLDNQEGESIGDPLLHKLQTKGCITILAQHFADALDRPRPSSSIKKLAAQMVHNGYTTQANNLAT